MIQTFKINQKVTATWLNNNYEVTGTVAKIVPPRTPLSSSDLMKFAKIDSDHKDYKSVEGEYCSVYRMVIEKGYDDYAIVPINKKSWNFTIWE